MEAQWNKICLVSTIVLSGLGICFVGCTPEALQNTYKDIYDYVNRPEEIPKITCVCSYTAYGKPQKEEIKTDAEDHECAYLQSNLRKEKKLIDAVCTPAQ